MHCKSCVTCKMQPKALLNGKRILRNKWQNKNSAYFGKKKSINEKFVLAKGSICHLPLWRLEPVMSQLLTFYMP